jgi:hypothetical protein
MSFRNMDRKAYEKECRDIDKQLRVLYMKYFVIVCDICGKEVRKATKKDAKQKGVIFKIHLCNKCITLGNGLLEKV